MSSARQPSPSAPPVHAAASHEPSEASPLLAPHHAEDNDSHSNRSSAASLLLRSIQEGQEPKKNAWLARWPSLLALAILCLMAIIVMIFAFIAPSMVQDYAKQALIVEPTSLSVDSFTSDGIIARVQANLKMDAGRVRTKPIRDIGRFVTYIAKEIETSQTEVVVRSPRFGNRLIGTASVPALKVNVRNGHITPIDFLTELRPGHGSTLRSIATQWIGGDLKELSIVGRAQVGIKSGIFSFGNQDISQPLTLKGDDLPSIPQYNISDLNFGEIQLPEGQGGIAATVALQVVNRYPLDFTIPPLGFRIMVPNCAPADPVIMLADATTASIHVRPKEDLAVNVTAFIRKLPEGLSTVCPNSEESPLDTLLGDYIHGAATTVYVQGTDSPSLDTPQWITDIIRGFTVPIPFPGHTFGHLIRKFSLADVDFSLPDSFAEPGTPGSQPQISAYIKALIALPKEINFPIDVHRVRADADVFYHGKKLGYLDLKNWQEAKSRPSKAFADEPGLEVESRINKAPLTVTDEDVFADVVQGLLTSKRSLNLTVKANVDVELDTALGKFIVRKIPADGFVPLKPISNGNFKSFSPKVGNLRIVDTNKTSITLDVLVNLTNPTEYSATVPFVDVHILVNDTILGHATARNITVKPGDNNNIPIRAVWQPFDASGFDGVTVGRALLSQYVSGYNTTLTLRTHNGTIPSQPALGRALKFLEFTMPTPNLGDHPEPIPGDDPDDEDEDEKPHFIKDATMHLFTSTAVFTLLSPLKQSIIYITYLNATAFYEFNPVGKILYDGSLAVPPGESTSPRLPVEWSLDSVGYQAVKHALGGTLKLTAKADVGLRVDHYVDRIWFAGKGIGAKVRI